MYVIHDESNGNVKLVEAVFNEVVFDVTVHEEFDVRVMIDFFLLYATIVSFD